MTSEFRSVGGCGGHLQAMGEKARRVQPFTEDVAAGGGALGRLLAAFLQGIAR